MLQVRLFIHFEYFFNRIFTGESFVKLNNWTDLGPDIFITRHKAFKFSHNLANHLQISHGMANCLPILTLSWRNAFKFSPETANWDKSRGQYPWSAWHACCWESYWPPGSSAPPPSWCLPSPRTGAASPASTATPGSWWSSPTPCDLCDSSLVRTRPLCDILMDYYCFDWC